MIHVGRDPRWRRLIVHGRAPQDKGRRAPAHCPDPISARISWNTLSKVEIWKCASKVFARTHMNSPSRLIPGNPCSRFLQTEGVWTVLARFPRNHLSRIRSNRIYTWYEFFRSGRSQGRAKRLYSNVLSEVRKTRFAFLQTEHVLTVCSQLCIRPVVAESRKYYPNTFRLQKRKTHFLIFARSITIVTFGATSGDQGCAGSRETLL